MQLRPAPIKLNMAGQMGQRRARLAVAGIRETVPGPGRRLAGNSKYPIWPENSYRARRPAGVPNGGSERVPASIFVTPHNDDLGPVSARRLWSAERRINQECRHQ